MAGVDRVRVCIVSLLHRADDGRIFHRQARSLEEAGYDVVLLAPHCRYEVIEHICIHPLPGPQKGFLARLIRIHPVAFALTVRQKADVYHFHDPELLLWIPLLRLLTRAKVIYDVHEDYPEVLSETIRIRWRRKLIKWTLRRAERCLIQWVRAVVAVTDDIAEHFPSGKTQVVRNFPRVEHFPTAKEKKQCAGQGFKNSYQVVYAGSLTLARGIRELVQAVGLLQSTHDVVLELVGELSDRTLLQELSRTEGFAQVTPLGWLAYGDMRQCLEKADIGLVCVHPLPRYQVSLPTKVFEYMAAGLPIVASNFPLWQKIVEGNGCGITVDPLDSTAIAEAIEYLLCNPQMRDQMGRAGRKVFVEKYNWNSEAKTLLDLYRELLTG